MQLWPLIDIGIDICFFLFSFVNILFSTFLLDEFSHCRFGILHSHVQDWIPQINRVAELYLGDSSLFQEHMKIVFLCVLYPYENNVRAIFEEDMVYLVEHLIKPKTPVLQLQQPKIDFHALLEEVHKLTNQCQKQAIKAVIGNRTGILLFHGCAGTG